MKVRFRDFKEARKFAHSLKLKSSNQWIAYCKTGKRPKDIPYKPQDGYKNKGWISWGDFLGNGQVASQKIQYLPFTSARKYVRTLKLENTTAWEKYVKTHKLPKGLPAFPNDVYTKERVGKMIK